MAMALRGDVSDRRCGGDEEFMAGGSCCLQTWWGIWVANCLSRDRVLQRGEKHAGCLEKTPCSLLVPHSLISAVLLLAQG